MTPRDDLIRSIYHRYSQNQMEALVDAYTRNLMKKILDDMERQGAGGQYDAGMKRAAHLIDPGRLT